MNQNEIKGLKRTIRVLENSAREFIEKTSNQFKHVYFSILGRLSFDKGINPKIFSLTSKSNIEAFNDGWNKAKQKRQTVREQDNGLEL